MRRFKYIIYTISIIILFLLPIYATARIFIPEWLKSQISSNLPNNTSIVFGEIKTNALLGTTIQSILFQNKNQSFSVIMSDLAFEPNLSVTKPVNFFINEIKLNTNETQIKFSNLEGSVVFDKEFKKENLTFSGDLKSLNSDEKNIASSISDISFIMKGFFSEKKDLKIKAKNMSIDNFSPSGEINIKGKNIYIDSEIRNFYLQTLNLMMLNLIYLTLV